MCIQRASLSVCLCAVGFSVFSVCVSTHMKVVYFYGGMPVVKVWQHSRETNKWRWSPSLTRSL